VVPGEEVNLNKVNLPEEEEVNLNLSPVALQVAQKEAMPNLVRRLPESCKRQRPG